MGFCLAGSGKRLFDESMVALRQWMRDNGIHFEMQQNEPEGHVGSLLLMTAWLDEMGRYRSKYKYQLRFLLRQSLILILSVTVNRPVLVPCTF